MNTSVAFFGPGFWTGFCADKIIYIFFNIEKLAFYYNRLCKYTSKYEKNTRMFYLKKCHGGAQPPKTSDLWHQQGT